MRRREFITLLGGAVAASSLLAPPTARAQQAGKIWRIGIIVGGVRTPPYDGFLQGMRELGYVSGRDYNTDWRFADGRFQRIIGFAEEFVKLKTDVIFVGTSAAVEPVRQVTKSIPIVMGYSTDPVGNGFVASMVRPGGNVTGLASSAADAAPKQFELLKTVVPGLVRVGVLHNPDNPNYAPVFKSTQAAALAAGLTLVAVDASDPGQIEDAFATIAKERAQALKVSSDALFFRQPRRLAELALQIRLPAIFPESEYAAAGGLMSYGESLREFYRRAASFVDRIFKGAKTGELPIEQPTRLNLVVNRKTAAALGVTIPQQVIAQADEVIE
jgi:putative tryptophan/tyrosine transport system substrate-binding protein